MKLVIFDMDGVLIDSEDYHFEALNSALGEYRVSREFHDTKCKGLSTKGKLKVIGVPEHSHKEIWSKKQNETYRVLSDYVKTDRDLMHIMSQLKAKGYQIAVASNSIRNTVKIIIERLGIMKYVDLFVSNQDVMRAKPFPEMYWKCMTLLNALPRNTVIIEDSELGRQGARDSGAHLLEVESRKDVNQSLITDITSVLQ